MVDREKVERKIQQLEEFLTYLRKLLQSAGRDIENDPIRLGSIKYYLQVSIESCIDMANHLISSERLRSPGITQIALLFYQSMASSAKSFRR